MIVSGTRISGILYPTTARRAGPSVCGDISGKAMNMRNLLALYLAIPLALSAADKKPPVPPKAGIKTPGIQIPIVSLKSEAVIDAAPLWIGVADQLLVPEQQLGTLLCLDPKTNKLDKPIPGVNKPCGG